MARTRFKVGIVGLEPGRSWAAKAHVPALRALPDDFEIVAVANTSLESGQRAAEALDLPMAYANADELVTSHDVDVVIVTVRVPHHFKIVKAAMEAGKHVYCEWPLGNGLAEAEELAALACRQGVAGIVGLQARVAPEVLFLERLVADGRIGDVLSTTLVAHGGQWGGIVSDKTNGAYLLDRENGATMLTIPVAHTLAGVQRVLGDVERISSVIATRRKKARVVGTGEEIAVTAPDQVLLNGVLEGGAPITVHYRGGLPRDGRGLWWEINGTMGDLRITAPIGHLQLAPLAVEAAFDGDKTFQPVRIPPAYNEGLTAEPVPGNVARVYARMARDLRGGTHTAPTFGSAIVLHRLVAAVEEAAASGTRREL